MKNTILGCAFVTEGKHDDYTGNRRDIVLVPRNSKVLGGVLYWQGVDKKVLMSLCVSAFLFIYFRNRMRMTLNVECLLD